MALDSPEAVASGAAVATPEAVSEVVPGLLSGANRRLTPRVPSQHAQGNAPAGPVLAVLVCHNGERWLPEALTGLRGQERRPDRVVAVDTGSRDGTSALLASALDGGLVDEIVRLDRRVGFGAAVQAALTATRATSPEHADGGTTAWLWLLHDDAAPEPAALAALVETAAADPAVAVVGPKLVGGRDGRRLLEVGAGVSGGGRRMTGLELGEVDQGQRDGVEDVLAVSTAGLLVRLSVWDELGGLDPDLPLFGDDLDLGWRARRAGHRVLCEPRAVVRHAEAARRGLRTVDVGRRFPVTLRHSPRLAERRAAALVLLLNAPWLELPLVALRLAAGALARAAGLVAASAPRAAAGELAAVAGALLRPDLVVAGRWRRRGRRRVGHREIRPYLSPHRRHHALREATAAVLAAATAREGRSGPGRDAGALGVLALGLVVVGVWPLRGLVGAHAVAGAAALPAPADLSQLITAMVGGWSPVGTGAAGQVPGAAGLLPLGLASLLVGGFPALAATVLVLLCVPAAGVSAALALRPLVRSRAVRCWAGAAYALLPGVVGAAWAGRPLSALAAVALPLLARLALAAVGPVVPLRWAATWATALVLALVTAAAPVAGLAALPVAVAVIVAGLASRTRVGGGRALRAAICLAGAAAVLLPQLRAVGATPYAVLAGAENPQPPPPVLDLLMLHPGGPGSLPLLLSVPVLTAGLAALLVGGGRAHGVRCAWVPALAGVAAALAAAALPGVTAGSAGDPAVVPWTGPALALGGLGVVTAAALGVEAARARLRRRRPGWRHIAAAALAVVAVAGPVAGAGALVSAGRQDPDRPWLAARPTSLHPARDVLPAFVSAELASADRPRALVLDEAGDGSLRWELVRREIQRLGSASPGDGPMSAALGDVVTALVSGQGQDVATSLAAAAVRYVVAPAPVDPDLRRTLDATPGLLALGPTGTDGVWQVPADASGPAARLRVTDFAGRTLSAVPAGDVRVRAVLPAGTPAASRLVLAEARDGGWRATVDGVPLAAVTPPGVVPWAQAWRLPAGGGTMRVWYAGEGDSANLLVPVAAGGMLALLATSSALAVRRRRRLAERRAQGAAA